MSRSPDVNQLQISGVKTAVALLLLFSYFGFGVSSASAAAPVLVSHHGPDSLISSTGNLYWTVDYFDELSGDSGADIFRAGKNSVPGRERRLYGESAASGAPRLRFSNIVYANLGGWYGFFIVNSTSSRIKRIPLAGGSATTIATNLPLGGGRDLKTDGVHLYWSDSGGIRRVALGGGAVSTLFSGPAGAIDLDANYVYFTTATSIRRVPKAGGAVTSQANAPDGVTAFYVHWSLGQTTLYWGDARGVVKSRVVGAAVTTTHQTFTNNTRINAVGYDGTRILWIDCTLPSTYCRVRQRVGGTTTTIVETAGSGSRYMVWDATQVFWSGGGQLKKFVH